MASPVLVLGSGDIASAVAHALFSAAQPVVIQEEPLPAVTRRGMAFADAVFDGRAELAGVTARRSTLDQLAGVLAEGAAFLPLVVGETELAMAAHPWGAVVDARMRKRSIPPNRRGSVARLIGLGPNFIAGGNCDIAIETSRDNLGAIITHGPTLPVGGEPKPIGGIGRDRYVYAPVAGICRTGFAIGQSVRRGETVARIGEVAVTAPMAGRIRGLVRDGLPVGLGAKLLEVDPRGDHAQVFGLGERPRAIAAAVLRSVLSHIAAVPVGADRA